MLDINDISQKIIEEKDNLVAKAFTCQIASLLLTNGIVPIMTEYRKENLDSITDSYRYKLVYELGVTFDSLDTSEHDKQIRAKAVDDYSNKLWQVIEMATINCKLDITIEDLRNIEIIIKGLAEEMKGE